MPVNIRTKLNGKDAVFEAEIHETAIEVLRKDAGLTGPKLVCGTGVCGACTIRVDGAAKCACLLPATQMENREITTVEGISGDDLHPVQKAFLANDGLQCGYCTPGFIVEAVAFYDEWRSKHGMKRPSKDEIAEAMAGHLCRCGAYLGIYEAVGDACEGKFDGREMPDTYRVDGREKVTGTAKYTTDIQLPGQLVGMVFRSKIPTGRIVSLDLSAAQNAPGVKAVIPIEGKDSFIRHEGQPLAAVAAETEAQAIIALKAIKLQVEASPFVVDAKKALQPSAPEVFPGDKKEVHNAAEGFSAPGKWEGNLKSVSLSITSSKKGEANKSVENAGENEKNVFRGKFETPTQFHTPLEPHCAVAHWTSAETLELYSSTQAVYFLAEDVAKAYDLKKENVLVHADYIGGAFGGKQLLNTESRAAIDLAKAAGAPVSVVLSRQEEFRSAGHRPRATVEVAATAEMDGTSAAYRMDAYGDSGAAAGSSIAEVSGLCYTGIAKSLHDYDVLTNFQPGAPFRGPGGPAACFSLEQSLDQLAEQLELDPIAFRRKWEDHEGFLSLFDWVDNLPLWNSRKAKGTQKGRFRTGVGLAFGGWFHLFMPSAEVEVTAGPEGFSVRNAVQDMGQGAKTVLAQAVADVFGIPPQAVKVEAGKSDLGRGPSSAGSRTTASIYPAAFEAATKVKEELEKSVSEEIIRPDMDPKDALAIWERILSVHPPISQKSSRGSNKGVNVMGIVPLGQGLNLGKGRGYGCYVIEVEVDTLLGKTRVTRVEGAMRVGKIHVRQGAENQCFGGVIQGIGHVLYEDRAICPETGKLLTIGMEDYHLPGIGDIPEINMTFLEEGFDFVKNKGIGLAELCTIPVAGAVANAVYNATGWRPMKAPIQPEELIAGLKK